MYMKKKASENPYREREGLYTVISTMEATRKIRIALHLGEVL